MAGNVIPGMRAGGKFEASAPFDRVVNPNVFYTVEAQRTIPEMQGLNINIYQRVFMPLGILEADYQTYITAAIAAGAVVISLIPRTGAPVYVLSTYLTAFPLVDGWSYERMCLVADMGALPPDLKPAFDQAKEHFQQYILAHYGIESRIQIGTIPVVGYLSQFEHDTMETTRKNRITDSTNDIATIRALEAQIVTKDAYIRDLEARLLALTPPPVPPDPVPEP